jgi:hypothetical protein
LNSFVLIEKRYELKAIADSIGLTSAGGMIFASISGTPGPPAGGGPGESGGGSGAGGGGNFSNNFDSKLKKHANDIYSTARENGVNIARGENCNERIYKFNHKNRKQAELYTI